MRGPPARLHPAALHRACAAGILVCGCVADWRRATGAPRRAQEVFPDAIVTVEETHQSFVKIFAPKHGNLQVACVPQRDLYSKCNWPAKPILIQHLQIFKEEYDN